jgi:hypothetical protein
LEIRSPKPSYFKLPAIAGITGLPECPVIFH